MRRAASGSGRCGPPTGYDETGRPRTERDSDAVLDGAHLALAVLPPHSHGSAHEAWGRSQAGVVDRERGRTAVLALAVGHRGTATGVRQRGAVARRPPPSLPLA